MSAHYIHYAKKSVILLNQKECVCRERTINGVVYPAKGFTVGLTWNES